MGSFAIGSLERNHRHYHEARDQLEKWAEDMIVASEKELRDAKEQIKVLNRQARQAVTVQEQHEIQEKIRDAETNAASARRYSTWRMKSPYDGTA